jgi:hypothetical protein
MAIAYHFVFFTRINPAAVAFGGLFLLAAALFVSHAHAGTIRFRRPGVSDAPALLLVTYALIAYPAINALTGHVYPRTPTFGLPCPTTIFTLGLLLLARRPVGAGLFVVPIFWSAIGTYAALRLGVVADYGLPAAVLVTTAVLLARAAQVGPKASVVGAVLRKWLLRGIRREARRRGHVAIARGLSDIALAAADIERRAPAAMREPSSAHWLAAAAAAVAAYRRMTNDGLAPEEARAIIATALTGPISRHVGLYLASRFGISSRHPEHAFDRIVTEFLPRGVSRFGRYWKFHESEHVASRFAVDVKRCLFNDFFRHAGAPELTGLFCELDMVWARELAHPRYGVAFSREHTLAGGWPACNFAFTRTDARGHAHDAVRRVLPVV